MTELEKMWLVSRRDQDWRLSSELSIYRLGRSNSSSAKARALLSLNLFRLEIIEDHYVAPSSRSQRIGGKLVSSAVM